MLYKLAAAGDIPAGEGFGAVFAAAANGLLALALIFIVLFIMNKVSGRKPGENEPDDEENNESTEGSDKE